MKCGEAEPTVICNMHQLSSQGILFLLLADLIVVNQSSWGVYCWDALQAYQVNSEENAVVNLQCAICVRNQQK